MPDPQPTASEGTSSARPRELSYGSLGKARSQGLRAPVKLLPATMHA